MRSSLGRASAALVSFCLLLSACGGDSVDHEALVKALTTHDVTVEQATCVADLIYTEGRFTEEELKNVAADINHEEVEGFEDAVLEAFDECGV